MESQFPAKYGLLPDYMRAAARRYLEDGDLPGDFLLAVLRNELVQAVLRADGTNRAVLPVWVRWLYNEIPYNAWGSAERVAAWSLARKNEKAQAEAERAVESQQEREIATRELADQ